MSHEFLPPKLFKAEWLGVKNSDFGQIPPIAIVMTNTITSTMLIIAVNIFNVKVGQQVSLSISPKDSLRGSPSFPIRKCNNELNHVILDIFE